MSGEDPLRELLKDPRWSLPVWPDAEARVRKAARRRQAITGIGAVAIAACRSGRWAAAGAAGRERLDGAAGHRTRREADHDRLCHAQPARDRPSAGAAGFRGEHLPAPGRHPAADPLGLRPGPSRLQVQAQAFQRPRWPSCVDRSVFGAKVNSFRFITKADITATVIASLANTREQAGLHPEALAKRPPPR